MGSAHTEGLHGGLPDLPVGGAQGVPDDVDEALDVHIEHCGGVLGHVLEDEGGGVLAVLRRLLVLVAHPQPPNGPFHLHEIVDFTTQILAYRVVMTRAGEGDNQLCSAATSSLSRTRSHPMAR